MKLSYTVASPEIKCSNVPAYKGEFKQILQKMVNWGYQGIELMVKDPIKFNQAKIVQLIRMYNLELPAVYTGEVFGENGLSFMDVDGAIRKLAIQRKKEITEFAAYFKAKSI